MIDSLALECLLLHFEFKLLLDGLIEEGRLVYDLNHIRIVGSDSDI